MQKQTLAKYPTLPQDVATGDDHDLPRAMGRSSNSQLSALSLEDIMARSTGFRRLLKIAGLAEAAERNHLESEATVRLAQERYDDARAWSRRQVLGLGAGAALASVMSSRALLAAPKVKPGFAGKVAILGGGLAGLAAADRLAAAGISATIYEATNRVGGRQSSDRSSFPGHAIELGGELIDNLHKTMLGYCNTFGLALEDLGKAPGEETFFFAGKHWSEAEAVDQYRIFSARAQSDFHASSGAPTATAYNEADVTLDHMTLAAFLDKHGSDLPLIRALLTEAYEAEYGLSTANQSALNFILFIHFDRRSKFTPFGVFSDERYHVVDGNDHIAQGIAATLPGPIVTGASIVALDRGADGRYLISLAGQKQPEVADAVICTLPFSVLRAKVALGAGLGLSAGKQFAIATMGYGTNAKTMIGFNGQPWTAYGSKGTCYSDQANVQNAWQTNYTRAGATSVLTDYASAERGVAVGAEPLQKSVGAFLTDLDVVWPGVKAAAQRDAKGAVRAVRAHWPSSPTQLGSYTCYTPGQFTTVCGLEGTPEGQLKFAGEHADSFYSWQGFMEGALLSGIRAAQEVLADIKAGILV